MMPPDGALGMMETRSTRFEMRFSLGRLLKGWKSRGLKQEMPLRAMHAKENIQSLSHPGNN